MNSAEETAQAWAQASAEAAWRKRLSGHRKQPGFAAPLVKMAPREPANGAPEKTKARKNSVLQKLVQQLLC